MKKSIVVFLAVLSCSVSLAGTVTLIWTNSPTPTVTTTRIYYGIASSSYTNFVPVSTPVNQVTVSNLVNGVRYYFAALAWDGDMESEPSNEVLAKLKPGKPSSLSVIAIDSK